MPDLLPGWVLMICRIALLIWVVAAGMWFIGEQRQRRQVGAGMISLIASIVAVFALLMGWLG